MAMEVLIIKDKSTEDRSLRFKTWALAAEHARMVIIPQIAEAIQQTLQQDDPSPWMEETKDMLDILIELHETDRRRVEQAIKDWAKLAEHDNFGDYWVVVA